MTMIEEGKFDYIISTSEHGRQPQESGVKIVRKAVEHLIPCLTSLDTARALATCLGMEKSMDDIGLVDITTL